MSKCPCACQNGGGGWGAKTGGTDQRNWLSHSETRDTAARQAGRQAGRRPVSTCAADRSSYLPGGRSLLLRSPGLLVLGPWSLCGAAMLSSRLRADCALISLWHFVSNKKKTNKQKKGCGEYLTIKEKGRETDVHRLRLCASARSAACGAPQQLPAASPKMFVCGAALELKTPPGSVVARAVRARSAPGM